MGNQVKKSTPPRVDPDAVLVNDEGMLIPPYIETDPDPTGIPVCAIDIFSEGET